MKTTALFLMLAALCLGCEGTTPGADGTLSFQHEDVETPSVFSFDNSVRRPLALGASALIVVSNDGSGTMVTEASSSDPKVLAVSIFGSQVLVKGVSVGSADLIVQDKNGAKGRLSISVHETASVELVVDWLFADPAAPSPSTIALRPNASATVRRVARDEGGNILMGAGVCDLQSSNPTLLHIKHISDGSDNRLIEHAGVAGMVDLSCGDSKLTVALDADDAVASLRVYDSNTFAPWEGGTIQLGSQLAILASATDKAGRSYADSTVKLSVSADSDAVVANAALPMVVLLKGAKLGKTMVHVSMGGAVLELPVEVVEP